MVVTSHGAPELEWQAENLVRLGLCVHLKKLDTTVESIRTAAAHMTRDATVLGNIKQMRYSVLQEPGAEEASNRIEEYIETGY
jgi:UDP:flavonoid glycosyltransferase YjiC (YdhE family)